MTATLLVSDLEDVMERLSEHKRAIPAETRLGTVIRMAKRGCFNHWTGTVPSLEIVDNLLRPITDWLGSADSIACKRLLGILNNLWNGTYNDPPVALFVPETEPHEDKKKPDAPAPERDEPIPPERIEKANARQALVAHCKDRDGIPAIDIFLQETYGIKLHPTREEVETATRRLSKQSDQRRAALAQAESRVVSVSAPVSDSHAPDETLLAHLRETFNIDLYRSRQNKGAPVRTKVGQKELEAEAETERKQALKRRRTPARSRVLTKLKVGVASTKSSQSKKRKAKTGKKQEQPKKKQKGAKLVEYTVDELEEVGIMCDSADEAERDLVPPTENDMGATETGKEGQEGEEEDESEASKTSPPWLSLKPLRPGPRRSGAQ